MCVEFMCLSHRPMPATPRQRARLPRPWTVPICRYDDELSPLPRCSSRLISSRCLLLPLPKLLTTEAGVDADVLLRDIDTVVRISNQVADHCSNQQRADSIRALAKKVRATAEQFESTSRGAAQDTLADTLRRDLASLEQHMRTAVAAAMAEAAIAEDTVSQLVEHACDGSQSTAVIDADKDAVRHHTAALTAAARNAGAMSDDPRRVQLVKTTCEQLEHTSVQVSQRGGW